MFRISLIAGCIVSEADSDYWWIRGQFMFSSHLLLSRMCSRIYPVAYQLFADRRRSISICRGADKRKQAFLLWRISYSTRCRVDCRCKFVEFACFINTVHEYNSYLIWSVTFVHTQSIAWEANTM